MTATGPRSRRRATLPSRFAPKPGSPATSRAIRKAPLCAPESCRSSRGGIAVELRDRGRRDQPRLARVVGAEPETVDGESLRQVLAVGHGHGDAEWARRRARRAHSAAKRAAERLRLLRGPEGRRKIQREGARIAVEDDDAQAAVGCCGIPRGRRKAAVGGGVDLGLASGEALGSDRLEGARQVEAAAAVDAVDARSAEVVGGLEQYLDHLARAEVWECLRQQRDRARDHRGRETGARPQVGLAVGAGRADSIAERGQVPGRARARPVREVRQLVEAGRAGRGRNPDRAGDDHLAGEALRRDQRKRVRVGALGLLAVVAGRDNEDDARAHRPLHRCEQVGGRGRAAQRHVDHLRPGETGGVDALGERRVVEGAATVLTGVGAAPWLVGAKRDDGRIESDAVHVDVVPRSGGDGADRRAMAVLVAQRAACGDVPAGGIDLARELAQRRVDAGVDDRDLDPLAGRAGSVGGDRAGGRGAVRALIFGRVVIGRLWRGRRRRRRRWRGWRGRGRRGWRGGRRGCADRRGTSVAAAASAPRKRKRDRASSGCQKCLTHTRSRPKWLKSNHFREALCI